MDVVKFPSGRSGSLTGVYGRVASVARWNDTIIGSSGGGGFVHPTNGGHVSAPKITSSIIERQEFWIETSDHQQHQYKLNIPLAKSHKLCLLWGVVDGKTELLYWNNYSSKRHSMISQKSPDFLLSEEDAVGAKNAFIVALVFSMLVCFFVANYSSHAITAGLSSAIWSGVPLGLLIGYFVRRAKRTQSMHKNIPLLTRICEETSDRLHGSLPG